MLLIVSLLFLAAAAEAAPVVSFPFNSQVPPLARVSEPFDFRFSPGTFTSALGALEYTLDASPPWLTLDSSNRRLYGTPTENDVGTPSFTIVAKDSEGSTSMRATMVVTTASAPKLNIDITQQLSRFGKLAGPRSLALQPSEQYSIQFPADTFTSSSAADLTYYATLSDRSPLPSWVTFNPDSMVFSGTASAAPQTIDVILIASDAIGFAGASLQFTLTVSAHEFVFANTQQTFNATPGSVVNITNLRNQLVLDGQTPTDADLGKATADSPAWLSLDPKTLNLTGTAPQDFNSANFTVSVTDRFGDVANTIVLLTTHTGMISREISDLVAVIGEPVQLDLKSVVKDQPGMQVEVQLGSAASWLRFNETSLIVMGTVPSSVSPQTIHSSIKVTTADGSRSETSAFNIVVKAVSANGSNTSSPRSTPATSDAVGASETSPANLSPHRGTPDKGAVIAVSVVCGVIALVALVLGYLLYRRSRRSKRFTCLRRRKEDISRPVYNDESDWQLRDDAFTVAQDVEKGEGTVGRMEALPPQIGMPSPLKKAAMERRDLRGHHPRPSHATSIGERDSQVLHNAIQSGDWSVRAGAIRSPLIPPGAGASSRKAGESPMRGRHSRRSFRIHRDSHESYARRSVGLPARRQVHGLGHGRTSFGSPSVRLSSRRSRNTSSFSSFSTLATGMLSNGLLSPTGSQFPVPPRSPSISNHFSNTENLKSVRIVPGSPMTGNSTVLTDARPLDERRQSYIRNRALNRSPFFAAHTSSRGSSGKHQSILEALADSLGSGGTEDGNMPRTLSPASYDALPGPVDGRAQFPGSLRRKRARQGRTARTYSQCAMATETLGHWRNANRGTIGPLAGTAPTESPRSSMLLSGLSDSAYTTTDGTGTEPGHHSRSSNGSAPADADDDGEEENPLDMDELEEGRPASFMTSPLSPSALRVNKQQQHARESTTPPSLHHLLMASSLRDKENTPCTPSSPRKACKSTPKTSPLHHRRSPQKQKTERRGRQRQVTDFATITTRDGRAGIMPTIDDITIDDLNYVALLRNSQRRRPISSGSSGGGKRLSAAVRQQLRQQDSIINRGRHHYHGVAATAGPMFRFLGTMGQQQEQRVMRGDSDDRAERLSDRTVGGDDDDDDDGDGDSKNNHNNSRQRVPLSTLSNVGSKTNFLAGSATGSAHDPRHYAPSSPSKTEKKARKTTGSRQRHIRQGSSMRSDADADNSARGRDLYSFGNRSSVFLPSPARRPVSVDGSPNRFTSVRGKIRDGPLGSASTAHLELRAGAWKTGEVGTDAAGMLPPPIPRKSQERIKAKGSSATGHEAFL